MKFNLGADCVCCVHPSGGEEGDDVPDDSVSGWEVEAEQPKGVQVTENMCALIHSNENTITLQERHFLWAEPMPSIAHPGPLFRNGINPRSIR